MTTKLTTRFLPAATSPAHYPQHFRGIVNAHGDNLALISRSQNKGDRVAVSLGNGWEFGAITYAIWKLGAVLVPLNPAFNTKQVVSALNHLEASHLIIGHETPLPFKPPRDNTPLLKDIIGDLGQLANEWKSEAVPSLKNVVLVNNSNDELASFPATINFQEMVSIYGSDKEKEVIPNQELHKDDVINIQFTSGTTSTPKAACLTHHSILNNGYFIGSRMALTPSDVVCCPPPLFHCFGSILGYMATATHGSTILFPSPAFNPSATLLSVQENKATALYGVATMFLAELELLSTGAIPHTGFEHLRTGIAAGSSVPPSLMEKLHKQLNLTGLTICYGMTETSPVSCMTTPTDPMEKRVDSVGKQLPHVSTKIISPSDPNKVLQIGQRGELAVSGYLVMKEYYADPNRTAEVLITDKDGKVWMKTGDEASMDEEGYVKITGRIKDLIIRGGENIHPLEIEDCIFGMEDVREVSVVGVPDHKYGEVVCAWIVPRQGLVKKGIKASNHDESSKAETEAKITEGEKGPNPTLTKEAIRHHVRTHLSGHLVPKYIFWMDEYPKTASGKIQKFKLKERAEWIIGSGGEQ
ncbi:amp-binding enzyme [Botrytis cinerea]